MVDCDLDDVDVDLIAALQHAPRAPFDVLARALGISARTVVRRYARMVENGLLRMICEVDWSLRAESVPVNVWVRTEPGAARQVALALVERNDTTLVSICSGRGDVYAVLHGATRTATAGALLTGLPRVEGIRSIRAEWVLRRFTSTSSWRLPRLSGDQLTALAGHRIRTGADARQEFDALARDLARVLCADARLSYSELARTLNISESRARRTATALIASGMLRPRVEVEPGRLGYLTEVVLSISCPPHAITEIATELRNHSGTRFLGLVTASSTLTYDGVFHNEAELADFLTTGAGAHPAITAVQSSLHLEVLKRYWIAR